MTAKAPCNCSERVLAWLEVKGRRSEATEKMYHWSIHDFVKTMNSTADELLRFPKQRVVDTLEKYLNKMVASGRAPKTTHVCMVAIQGFLEHNGKKVEHKFSYDATSRKTSYLTDIVPDAETLDKVLSYASPTGKVVISLMAYSGLRPALITGLKIGGGEA